MRTSAQTCVTGLQLDQRGGAVRSPASLMRLQRGSGAANMSIERCAVELVPAAMIAIRLSNKDLEQATTAKLIPLRTDLL